MLDPSVLDKLPYPLGFVDSLHAIQYRGIIHATPLSNYYPNKPLQLNSAPVSINFDNNTQPNDFKRS